MTLLLYREIRKLLRIISLHIAAPEKACIPAIYVVNMITIVPIFFGLEGNLMSEKIIEKCCRRVGKGLICLPITKERLLPGLQAGKNLSFLL